MKKMVVIYHSAHGHTAYFASHVAGGARTVPGLAVSVLDVAQIETPETLAAFGGIIWGSPTYLGGVSGPFKSFMDKTGGLWRRQTLKGKLAAGFTVSSLPSGDKLGTLMSLFLFSMQHGMSWIGNPFLPGTLEGIPPEQAINRLGSWSGAMAEAAHGTAPEAAFLPGDLLGAQAFGRNFAEVLVLDCLRHRGAAQPPPGLRLA